MLLSIKLFRTNRRLRCSTLKYHLVADYTSDWEYWISPEGKVVYMSPSCQQFTGYSVQEFKQRPELLEQLVYGDDKAHYLQHWNNHNQAQQFGDLEYRIQARDGSLHWIHHLCQPVFDREQRYQGIRASNRDITTRKKMELDLRLHDIALKSCVDAIVITDLNAVVQWVNPAFCQLTGYTEAEALGRNLAELIKSGQHTEDFYHALWQTILSGQSWRGEIINRRKNGDLYHEQLSITPVYSYDQTISHFVAVKQDISERKLTEEQINQLAFYDPLTRLANRRLLMDRLEHAVCSCRRTRQFGALLFLDLDKFKPLNDRYGHDVGDRLLVQVANRLKAQVREQDTVARLGGDEFVILLDELDFEAMEASRQAQQVADKIQKAIGQVFKLDIDDSSGGMLSIEYHLSASIGLTLFNDEDENGEKILKQADMAMYDAKRDGRNRILAFVLASA